MCVEEKGGGGGGECLILESVGPPFPPFPPLLPLLLLNDQCGVGDGIAAQKRQEGRRECEERMEGKASDCLSGQEGGAEVDG